jgi:hypothetical protein
MIETRQWVESKGWKRMVKVVRKKPYIVDEIVEKFRHTVFAVACAQRASAPELIHHFIVNDHTALTVVLLLTWESREFRRLAVRLQHKLRQALAPYAVDAYIINETIPATVALDCKISRVNTD